MKNINTICKLLGEKGRDICFTVFHRRHERHHAYYRGFLAAQLAPPCFIIYRDVEDSCHFRASGDDARLPLRADDDDSRDERRMHAAMRETVRHYILFKAEE